MCRVLDVRHTIVPPGCQSALFQLPSLRFALTCNRRYPYKPYGRSDHIVAPDGDGRLDEGWQVAKTIDFGETPPERPVGIALLSTYQAKDASGVLLKHERVKGEAEGPLQLNLRNHDSQWHCRHCHCEGASGATIKQVSRA